jgi:hypothetical protein
LKVIDYDFGFTSRKEISGKSGVLGFVEERF